ncbi:hypothetical protein GLOIN_2v1766892 [Rhizophagus irregularis DAOM 181602=DAOM 197198]|nr:hypothetical protein GLOIN_2v1766892 [Rhizophagus irregularis DAOM 181602=DAOM 197198]
MSSQDPLGTFATAFAIAFAIAISTSMVTTIFISIISTFTFLTFVTATVSPYPSSQQQLPYPSYSSQHLQHPSTQLLSDEEIDNLLATLFLQIEDIMSRAVNPVYVRQSIAERFAMTLPEHLHDQIEQMIHRGKRSSEERSRTSSSSTPIMTTPTLTRTDSMDTLEEIPLITQSSTSTSSLGIAIPSVTSLTLPRMNPM